jgi:hypothetical protein
MVERKVWMSNEGVKALFAYYFKWNGEPLRLYNYQANIVRPIINREHKRIVISACTRVGKTFAIGRVPIILAIKYPGIKITLLGPDYPRADLLAESFFEGLGDSPEIQALLPEVSPMKRKPGEKYTSRRVTFKNGSQVRVVAAHGAPGSKGKNLLGKGAGDFLIVDESPLIDDEVFNAYVFRMLADTPETVFVQIGNPVNLGHFYKDFTDKSNLQLRITADDALTEGRFTPEFIEEAARKLGGKESPLYRMLYGADFVEEVTGALIPLSAIKEAIDKKIEFPDVGEKPWKDLGVDVARYGTDLTVLQPVRRTTELFRFLTPQSHPMTSVTSTVGLVINEFSRAAEKGKPYRNATVDDLGVGGGVTDFLEERDVPVTAFIASKKARDDKHFANAKSEQAWELRTAFIEGRVSIPNHAKLIEQLQNEKYEFDSHGRIKVVDPSDKSPDFFDALLLSTVYWAVYAGGVNSFR